MEKSQGPIPESLPTSAPTTALPNSSLTTFSPNSLGNHLKIGTSSRTFSEQTFSEQTDLGGRIIPICGHL